jgi:hypothetical protein
MSALAGPFVVAAAILAVGGGAKLVRPASTAGALAALRLPSAPALVRAGGGLEIAIGLGALTVGGSLLAALVALSYLAFAAFVVLALVRRTPIASCGCFGTADTPPTLTHVVVDLSGAAVAGAIALGPTPSLADVLGAQPLLGIPFVLLCSIAAFLSYIALTLLPGLGVLEGTRS